MVRINPRTFVTQQADTELRQFMLDLERKHNLTAAEVVMIISNYLASFGTSLVREERQVEHEQQFGVKDDEDGKI